MVSDSNDLKLLESLPEKLTKGGIIVAKKYYNWLRKKWKREYKSRK